MAEFLAGLDLGTQQDYSVLSVTERVEIKGGPRTERTEYTPALPSWWADSEYAQVYGMVTPPPHIWPRIVEEKVVQDVTTEYHLRHLERLPLGTSYPRIVDSVCATLARPPLAGQTVLLVDITGVGRPVWDMLRERDIPGGMFGITITGADQVTREGREFRTPKRDLIVSLQVLLQQGRLKFATGLKLRDVLVAELQNFRQKISLAGHDSYEAGGAGPAGQWREAGSHDDIVLATAMPVWYAEQGSGYGPRVRFFD